MSESDLSNTGTGYQAEDSAGQDASESGTPAARRTRSPRDSRTNRSSRSARQSAGSSAPLDPSAAPAKIPAEILAAALKGEDVDLHSVGIDGTIPGANLPKRGRGRPSKAQLKAEEEASLKVQLAYIQARARAQEMAHGEDSGSRQETGYDLGAVISVNSDSSAPSASTGAAGSPVGADAPVQKRRRGRPSRASLQEQANTAATATAATAAGADTAGSADEPASSGAESAGQTVRRTHRTFSDRDNRDSQSRDSQSRDSQNRDNRDYQGKDSARQSNRGRKAQNQNNNGKQGQNQNNNGNGNNGNNSQGKQSRRQQFDSRNERNERNNNGNGNNGQDKLSRRQQRRNNQAMREPAKPTVTREELQELRIAELRTRATEAGVDTNGLKKGELVEALYSALVKQEGFIEFSGILDMMQEGFGFVHTKGYLPNESDIFVDARSIRQLGLRRGDEISGVAHRSRSNDKNPQLNRVITLNGVPFEEVHNRPRFGELTPVFPDERLVMEHAKDSILGRCIDLCAPIGKGQRGLIVSPPKAGKTTVLKGIAASITQNNPEVHLICLLVDERPEEVTDMQRSIKGEVVASTFDMPCENHINVSELVIERAKRLVELGRDVVILLDSITRLARAYNMAQPASGRILTGGVDATALYPPKRFLGAARNIEHGGSLTILASALVETGSKMDEVIFEEFKGTGNMELRLDRDLADRRIFPAIDPIASGTRKEELLIDPNMTAFVWGLRRTLASMNNNERAMSQLIKGLKATENNREFLIRCAKKAQQADLNM